MALTTDEVPSAADERVTDPAVATPRSPAGPEGPNGVDGEAEASASVGVALRTVVALAFPTMAAGVMVGGVFTGASARVLAVVAGLLGLALAVGVARLRSPAAVNVAMVGGVFLVGVAMVVPDGVGNIPDVGNLARRAAASGDVVRPPASLTTGWQAIVGWLLALTGFVTGWVALRLDRPAIALLVPLPVAAVAGISIPESQQVTSGIVVLVLFAVGLGLIASEEAAGEDGTRPPIAYEVRKAAKAVPLLAAITVALVLLSQTDFLFPDPVIDPAEEPQKPRTTPITEVEDRVLFEVSDPDGGEIGIRGPWRLGVLDVYDGIDWRLPAVNDNRVTEIPDNGIVDTDLFGRAGLKADITIAGLGGTVFPSLPNTVAVLAEGPRLGYDVRSGSIRVEQGEVAAGNTIRVAAARLPEIGELRQAAAKPVAASLEEFIAIPDPPPAVQSLLDDALAATDNLWDRFDYLRQFVLEEVVATGLGTPVSVTPERANEILGTTREASPFEIVAVQAMLGRWAGVPTRIGYGYDGGDVVNGNLQVRPKNGAAFPEVYFAGLKWLPVIGTPRQAEPTVGSDPSTQQVDPQILPSDDIAVKLFLPIVEPPASTTGRQLQLTAGMVVLAAIALGALWNAYPVLHKSIVRSRRRAAAAAAGPRARVALAYAEFRDMAADYGFEHGTDTPLMYQERFVVDPEHTELAWLVTRVLWGDRRDDVTDADAVQAEQLSRSVVRRLGAAQPATVRAVASMSRTSMRRPWAPETDLTRHPAERADDLVEAVASYSASGGGD